MTDTEFVAVAVRRLEEIQREVRELQHRQMFADKDVEGMRQACLAMEDAKLKLLFFVRTAASHGLQ